MKCPFCDKGIDESVPIRIHGYADVSGVTSLSQFKREGVEWEPIEDTTNEYIECPHCGRRVTPHGYKAE